MPAGINDMNAGDATGTGNSAANARHTTTQDHSLANTYRRPSFVASYGRPSLLASSPVPKSYLAPAEISELDNEERELIREARQNHKHVKDNKRSYGTLPSDRPRRSSSTQQRENDPGETCSLIPEAPLEQQWDEAVKENAIESSYRHETRVLSSYSAPLIITFLLQSSEQFSTVFSLGHLGTVELGASSLSTMLAAITGLSVFQGIITSLDTLCTQAYGSGRKELVGIQVQRCLLLLALMHIPVIAVWLNSEALMLALKQDPEVSRLVGRYMKVFILGMPAFALFETCKRFLQAQGLMTASTYVLFISAPINIILNYALVWHKTIGFGFLGAPTAVVITYWLQATLLILYICFVDGKQAWNGFSKAAFKNWGPMTKLAVPGVICVCSEWGAFEITSLAASYLGKNELAAQSILNTTASIIFQIPFAISVAVSSRVGNLLGGGLGRAAKISCDVALTMAAIISLLSAAALFLFRRRWGLLFTNDHDVVLLVSEVLPLLAFFEIFDCLGAIAGGILRGMGRQSFGAYVNIPSVNSLCELKEVC